MNKSKVKEIIKFSLYKNIQNKWFIIFNLITLISIIVMLNWSSVSKIFSDDSNNESFKIAVLDDANIVYENFKNLNIDQVTFEVEKISENNYTEENIPEDFAIVEILPDEKEGFKTSIISKEGIDSNIYNEITDNLYSIRNDMLSQKYGIKHDDLKILQSELSINRIMLGVDAEDSNTKELIKLFSSFFTYFVTLLIFSKMANEIAQEKQSKSSEYILTTVSAKEYLFAKIFSNITVLLIQGLLLFAYYFIAIGLMNIINISTTDITLSTGIMTNTLSMDIVMYILSLIVYNVLTLILLCIIQATLSAKTASTSEAGNTVSLLTFTMMAAYIATISILTPYTKVNTLLYVISCLPLISAYFVPGMMVIGQATTIQIIISLIILVVSIPLTFNFCSTKFKNGILDYTKVKKEKKKDINKDEERKNFLMKRSIKNIGFVTGISILLYIGLQTVLSLIGNFVLPTLLRNIFSETDITLILQMVLQITSLGIASAFMLAYCNKNNNVITDSSRKLTVFSKFKLILITLLIIFGLQILLSAVLYPKLGLDYNVTDMFVVNSESSIITKIILILAIAVTPAIFEELFFRKALIDFTLPYGKNFALLFSSLLFGIIHMNLSQGLFAFIIGLVFGIIYLYTKDIKISMLIHFINNGFAAIAMILPEFALILVTLLLIAFLIAGFVFLIITLVKKDSREKLMRLFKTKVSLDAIKYKYKYILTDFTFDVSMLLVLVMSILTENILR
ncbi:MAG: CPBP family intramembrane metalloprotease [Clostridia bacterium]|nr:CPBP family intramembrane metalloprotease [Clostridia bacterium]